MSISHSMGDGGIDIPKYMKYYDPDGGCQIVERKIWGDKNIEHRVALHSEDFGEAHKCIGQLIMNFPDGVYGGSATVVSCFVGGRKTYFLLSCAHNFCQLKLDVECDGQKYVSFFPDKIVFQRGRDGENCLSTCEVDKFFIPESYLLQKDDGPAKLMAMGIDYAICTLKGDLSNLEDAKLPELLSLNVLDDEKFDTKEVINITGYPGEYNGVMYTMSGSAKNINAKPSGVVLTYKNINTTAGQSGSPIMQQGMIKAVHVGSLKVNVGTVITRSVKEWIRCEVSTHVAKTWLQSKYKNEKINFVALNLLAKMALESDNVKRKNILIQSLESTLTAHNEVCGKYLNMVALERFPECYDRVDPLLRCLPDICILGMRGHGKSSLINSLTEEKVMADFHVRNNTFSACTKKVSTFECKWFDGQGYATFIDVPGFTNSVSEDGAYAKLMYDQLKSRNSMSSVIFAIRGDYVCDGSLSKMMEYYKALLQLNIELWNHIAIVITGVDYSEKYVRKGGIKEWKRVLCDKEVSVRTALHDIKSISDDVGDVTIIALGSLDYPDGHFYWLGHSARTEIINRLKLIKSFVKQNIACGATFKVQESEMLPGKLKPVLPMIFLRENFKNELLTFWSSRIPAIVDEVVPRILNKTPSIGENLVALNLQIEVEGMMLVRKHVELFYHHHWRCFNVDNFNSSSSDMIANLPRLRSVIRSINHFPALIDAKYVNFFITKSLGLADQDEACKNRAAIFKEYLELTYNAEFKE